MWCHGSLTLIHSTLSSRSEHIVSQQQHIDLKLILWSVLLHSKFCNLLCASDFTCTDV